MITSKQNHLIRAFRASDDLFLVEGAKLVKEALEAGFLPKLAAFGESARNEHPELFARLSGIIETSLITPYLAEYIADTKNPQGIFAKFERKRNFVDFGEARRVIILDRVQDPGNAGAIIRSCEAFGFDFIIRSNDSVDFYNPKVIRASAGSVFRLTELQGELHELIGKLKRSGFLVLASVLDDDAVPLKKAAEEVSAVCDGKVAVIIGNEGKGISAEMLAFCDRKLYIPIKGAESLNAGVAAGIICYELGVKG
ncbi:MAG: RNA methyltransferase [Oscillospiraceae bacterium]|nr:RNA methyltransferase [Oscillospiraceae bacterium]